MINTLEIINMHAEAKDEDKKILKGINLKIKSGEIHAIMGPNGSGKSTLCKILMGHPKYKVTQGSIKFNNEEINNLSTDKRAKLGLFLGFQSPTTIPGVNFERFLRTAKAVKSTEKIDLLNFHNELKKKFNLMNLSEEMAERSVNEGFSGGEKKKMEIIQMEILEPKISLLDEIDSGLDIDALKIVAKNIQKIFEKNNTGLLIITHYQRILDYIEPHFVHIMANGKIIKSGDKSLAKKLEKDGYEKFLK